MPPRVRTPNTPREIGIGIRNSGALTPSGLDVSPVRIAKSPWDPRSVAVDPSTHRSEIVRAKPPTKVLVFPDGCCRAWRLQPQNHPPDGRRRQSDRLSAGKAPLRVDLNELDCASRPDSHRGKRWAGDPMHKNDRSAPGAEAAPNVAEWRQVNCSA